MLIIFLLVMSFWSCAQTSNIPLSWSYNGSIESANVFYIYVYTTTDTMIVDTTKIVLVDSTIAAGVGDYQKTISINLNNKYFHAFYARAGNIKNELCLLSSLSNRTRFIKTPQKAFNLKIK